MPIKGGKLTRKENRFIDEMVKTGDKVYSARRAGYAHPDTAGHIVAAKDVIDASIRQRSAAKLQNEAVPIAIDVLIEIMLDKKQPGNTRVNAADKALKHANAGVEGAEGKEPHEMTADELARAIERLNQVKADRARPIVELEPLVDTGLFD